MQVKADPSGIHVTYNGRLLLDTMTAYVTPVFHTGDERYLWMNRIQSVAKGGFPTPDRLVYEMFELR